MRTFSTCNRFVTSFQPFLQDSDKGAIISNSSNNNTHQMHQQHILMPRKQLQIPSNDIANCLCCNGTDLNTDNSCMITHEELFTAYLEHQTLIQANYKICDNCLPLDYDTIPLSPITSRLKLSTYHRTLQNIQSHIKSKLKSHEKHIQSLQNESTFDRIRRQSPNKIKSFCRLSIENIQYLSTTYNIDPNDLFLFYTINFRNDPYEYLGTIFGLSKSTISSHYRKVLFKLHDQFVPTQLNTAWTRNKVRFNTPDYVQHLFGTTDQDRIVLMTDGTMVYCQKSKNFNIQKRDHNSYKKRNCMVFMSIMTANGRLDYLAYDKSKSQHMRW